MVARAVERNTGLHEPPERIGQRRARRIEHRQVIEPGGVRRRRRAAEALPGIQADMVVVAPGGDEGRGGAVTLHQLEAEHAAIEG